MAVKLFVNAGTFVIVAVVKVRLEITWLLPFKSKVPELPKLIIAPAESALLASITILPPPLVKMVPPVNVLLFPKVTLPAPCLISAVVPVILPEPVNR